MSIGNSITATRGSGDIKCSKSFIYSCFLATIWRSAQYLNTPNLHHQFIVSKLKNNHSCKFLSLGQ